MQDGMEDVAIGFLDFGIDRVKVKEKQMCKRNIVVFPASEGGHHRKSRWFKQTAGNFVQVLSRIRK